MPKYRYIATAQDGSTLKGEAVARDKNELFQLLKQNRQSPVSCEEIAEARPKVSRAKGDKEVEESAESVVNTITAILWTVHAMRQEGQGVPSSNADAQKKKGDINLADVIRWISANKTAVLAVLSCLLLFYVLKNIHGTRSSRPRIAPRRSVALAPVTQPDMSETVVNGRPRNRKVFKFKVARASTVKSALDQVMRGSSMTSELSPSTDNSLVVRAIGGELWVIDHSIMEIDKDFGEGSEEQTIFAMIEALSAAKEKAISNAPWKKTAAHPRAAAPRRRR